MSKVDEVSALLKTMSQEELRQTLALVRTLLPKHPVEESLFISSDAILHALGRAGDFTVRMIRGVFAEAAFAADVLPLLSPRWSEEKRDVADPPYDFLLSDGAAPNGSAFANVRVQVKLQRSEAKAPLLASEVWTTKVKWPKTHFVVEVQKSRKGEKRGQSTRPYRFGEFDILAVSLGPSTGKWSNFMYTVERWLLLNPEAPSCLLTYQPVSPVDNDCWTTDFNTAVEWLRSGVAKRIEGDLPKGKAKRGKAKRPRA